METNRAKQISDSFKIRASATADICAGEVGLTQKQSERLTELEKRNSGDGKPLTDNMKVELAELIKKQANPELPEGAKTHCKKWLKTYLFGRREELNNKYVVKGNEQEDEAFTLMALQLNLGMVYKNTEYRENEYICGTCDLDLITKGFDNKCSWSLDTFPMFENDIPDKRYWWQLQNYAIRYDAWTDLSLCYTLVNASELQVLTAIKYADTDNDKYKIAERMVFDAKTFNYLKADYFSLATLDTFIEIEEKYRIKEFCFKPDQKAKDTIKERAIMCQEYIFKLLTNNLM
jgi:hypothetical protein